MDKLMMPAGLARAFFMLGAVWWVMGPFGVYYVFGACLLGWLLDMDSF